MLKPFPPCVTFIKKIFLIEDDKIEQFRTNYRKTLDLD